MLEEKYYLGFSLFPGIGSLRFKLLLNYFKSVQKAWDADIKILKETGLGNKIPQNFDIFRKKFSFEKEEEKLKNKNISYIGQCSNFYPKLLKEIPDPPIGLFIKGDIRKDWGWERTVAVVGTRQITGYGTEMTQKITKGLVEAGVTIVSGMAYGVDTIAHETAVSNGGKTIAVLGCGVDIIYPPSNANLYKRIIDEFGLVLSEFPPGQLTTKGLFPSRNRIISGLSLGVVVTEGAEDSGSLITARNALEQGREVFAVPGQVTSYLSKGPLNLIKQGAKLVTEAGDILEDLNIKYKRVNIKDTSKILNINLSDEEKKIVEVLNSENLHFDEIARKTGIESGKLGSMLTMMEMKSVIKNLGEGNYMINTD